MIIKFLGLKDELKAGVDVLADYMGVTVGDGGYEFTVTQKGGCNLVVTLDGKKGTIVYAEKCHFFRAFGLAV